jgi:tape measure domain-containing protein
MQIGSVFATLSANISDFQRKMEQAGKSVQSFAGKFTKNIEDTNKKTLGFQKAISNLAGGVVNFATKAVKTMITGIARIGSALYGAAAGVVVFGINTAKDIEMSRASFEALLGSAEKAKEMMFELAKFAKRTPFSNAEVRKYAENLIAVGFASEEVIPNMEMLGNLSRGNSRKLELIALAFSQVKSAGKLAGQELNQFAQSSVPLLGLLAKHFNTTEAEIRKMMEASKISFADVDKVLKEYTKGQDLMEKQANTLTGRIEKMKESLTDLALKLVGVDQAGDIVEGGVFDRFSKWVDKMADWVDQHGEVIVDFILKAFDLMGQGWSLWYNHVLLPMIKFFIDNKQTFIDFWENMQKSFGSVIKFFTDNKNIFENWWVIQKENMAKAWDFLKNLYETLLKPVIDSIIKDIEDLAKQVSDFYKEHEETIKKLQELFGIFLMAFVLVIVGVALAILGLIKGIIWLGSKILEITDWVYTKVEEVQALWQKFVDFWNSSTEEKIKSIAWWFGYLVGKSIERFTQIHNGVRDWVIGAFNWIVSEVSKLPETIRNNFDAMARAGEEKGQEFQQKVKDKIEALKKMSWEDIGKAIVNGLINGINSKIGELKEAVGGIAKSFKDGLNSAGVEIPNLSLPKFASGGIVGGNNTSGDQLIARVNSGEMILNKAQQANLFDMINKGNNGGANINITINESSNPRLTAQLVQDTIAKALTGGRLGMNNNI